MNNIPIHPLFQYNGKTVLLNSENRYGCDCFFHFVDPCNNSHLMGYSLFLIDKNGIYLEPGIESIDFDGMDFNDTNDGLKIIGVDMI